MLVNMYKAKIHRIKVTQAEIHYVGSITVDAALLEAAGIQAGERVQIVNINNGARFETYTIEGQRHSGICSVNGPAARHVQVGDIIIIINYAWMEMEEAQKLEAITIFPNEYNMLDK